MMNHRIRLLVGTGRSQPQPHWPANGDTETSSLEIVAHARNGSDVIRKVAELHPEAVLVDTELSGVNQLGLGPLGRHDPRACAVLLCLHEPTAAELSQRVLAAACTYVLETAELADVARLIRSVHTVRCPRIESAQNARRVLPLDPTLTCRERQILGHVAREMTSKDIGSVLRISPRTVDAHRANLMKKLGIHTIAGLVRYAFEHGVFDGESPS